MSGVIWSPPALLDVQRLYHFLKPKNIDAAKRAIQVIREGLKVLAKQPEVGKPIEDMDPEYREWSIRFGGSGYVVLYRYNGQVAVILSVRHQKELEP